MQITLHTSTSNRLQNTTNRLVDFFSRNCLCHISIIWLSSCITLMGWERSWPSGYGVGLRTLGSWVRSPHWAWFAFEA